MRYKKLCSVINKTIIAELLYALRLGCSEQSPIFINLVRISGEYGHVKLNINLHDDVKRVVYHPVQEINLNFPAEGLSVLMI